MDQRYPDLAAGKAVVFQTKLGALRHVSSRFQPGAIVWVQTYYSLDHISEVVAHGDKKCTLLGVI